MKEDHPGDDTSGSLSSRRFLKSLESNDAPTVIQQITAAVVRLIGVFVLFVGLWVGVTVILEAWALYEEPERIERLAAAVERGSNIDRIFSATEERISSEIAAGSAASPPAAGTTRADKGLRLSYFAAWIIAMMLFLIIGSLAMAAISIGGRLALYDSGMKKFSRQVVREFQRFKRAA